MKQRTISGVIMAIIIIPFLILGSYFLKAFVAFLAIWGCKELLGVKKENKFPLYIQITTYVLMLLLVFVNFNAKNYEIIAPLIIASLFIFLAYVVVDHRFKLLDATYIITMLILVSSGLKGIIYLRECDFFYVVYLFLITCLTDIFAQLGGIFFKKVLKGKVHLLNSISPKKTWEGSLSGTFVATLGASLFFIIALPNTLAAPLVFLMTFLLSIVSQFGDLFFSSCKRTFDIKDYSNLIPGHGGVLDRIDSLIATSTVLALIMQLLIK